MNTKELNKVAIKMLDIALNECSNGKELADVLSIAYIKAVGKMLEETGGEKYLTGVGEWKITLERLKEHHHNEEKSLH